MVVLEFCVDQRINLTEEKGNSCSGIQLIL